MGQAAADTLSQWLSDISRAADVTFQAPERLWFGLPLLGVLVLVPVARRVRAGDALWPLGLRALALAALLAILLEPAVKDARTRRGRLLILADVSPSIGAAGLMRTQSYLDGAGAPYDLVTFGATPTLVGEQVDGATLHGDPRDATDLAAAFRLAAVRANREEPLRIVLISDGRATEPGAQDAALRLRRAAELWAVAVPDAPATDAPALTARSLELPPRDKRREPFAIKAHVEAAAAARVRATLFLDGRPHRTETIELSAGESDVVFQNLTLAPGRYFAQVLFGPDATPHDNVAAAELDVPGVPRVLCLARTKRNALVADALRTQGIDVDVGAAGAKHDLSGYDAVVLLPDAPSADLERHAPALADFVAHGGGLVAVGGAEGAGLARLHFTPLAFLLPLEFEPRAPATPTPPTPKPADKPRIEVIEEKKEAYPITLGLVVDRSGSMDGYKLRQAQLAAIAAARTLTPQDRILLVAFGDQAEILMSPHSAGDLRAVGRAVSGLYAQGQTAMFQALTLAHDWMQREPSPIRHVLLISDGRPTDVGRWRDLVTRMVNEKITVSSVGIGMDVDSHLLGRIAQWGRGKYWLARAHEIPQVVTQDTKRIVAARDRRGKDAERTRPEEEPEPEPEMEPEDEKPSAAPPVTVPIVPERGAPRDMLKGLRDDELPRVAGAEEGKPRFASWTAARAGTDGPPLLAYWRFGLGTAAVLTIDPEASGAKQMREHEDFPRLIAQLVRSVLPDTHGEAFVLQQALRAGGDGEDSLSLRILAEDGLPRTDLPLEVALSDGTPLPVRRRADRYEAALPHRPAETRVDVRLGPATAPLLERSLVLPPSGNRELARTGPDRRTLLRLVGDPARLDPPAGQVLAAPEIQLARLRPLWLPFLLFAAILLPFDAWARRRIRSASR